jgi:hypothetical protein
MLVAIERCNTCSLTLREKYKVRVFKNRVQRNVFGPKRHVTGD